MSYKIGIGYDIHRLVEGRKLFIGGVEIPYLRGLLGHSDGDVLLHAICDALLGAVGEADIGEQFPDTEAQYQDISSVVLLNKVYVLVKQKGFRIGNIDAVVIAQEPKLSPFRDKIQQKLAETLGIKPESVGIKAKTNEGLGDIGNSQAIAAYAAVILSQGR